MPQNQTALPFQAASVALFLKIYADQLDAWRKACERLLAESQSVPLDPAGADALARRMIEAQAEICKFMTHGAEEYQKVLHAFAECRSPEEALQLQMSFLSRMMTACSAETGRLIQPFMAMARHAERGTGQH